MQLRLLTLTIALGLIGAACGGSDSDELDGDALEIYPGECAESTGESITVYSGRTENLMEPVFDAFECQSGILLLLGL